MAQNNLERAAGPVGLKARASRLTEQIGTLITPESKQNILSLDPHDIFDHLKSSGAVVFKDFGATVAEFEAFSNQFSNDFMDNRGSGSWRKTVNMGSDGTIQDVAYRYGAGQQRTFPLPLHADRSYTRSTPEVMFFMCGHPAEHDGQTTVCDGIRVYETFSDATRNLFETKKLKYIRHYTDGEWQLLYKTDEIDDVEAYCRDNNMTLTVNTDSSIRTEFVRSAVPLTRWQQCRSFCNSLQIGYWQEHGLKRKTNYVRLEDNSEIPAEVMDEVNEVTAALTADIEWQPGDVAIVDNTRVLHGRRSFTDERREIYARMCRRFTL